MSYSPHSAERSSNVLPSGYSIPAKSTGSLGDTSPAQQPPVNTQRNGPPRHASTLPPLATLTATVENVREQGNSGSSTPWRPLGVRNILNPAAEGQTAQVQAVPPSPQASSIAGHHGSYPAPVSSPHVRKRGEPHSPNVEAQTQHGGRVGRRILTPRSPSLRAASLGTHRSPSLGGGHITRVPLPSGEGRVYTAEPGDSRDAAIPPLPPLSSTTRNALAGLTPRDLTSPAMPTAANSTSFACIPPQAPQQDLRPESGRPHLQNNEARSPNFAPGNDQMARNPAPGVSEAQSGYLHGASGPVRSGLPYGQTEYQLTFETQQGPMVVPVNVDYQQASRVADEKRKRNAGASARFRARRKEKEREANQTIAGLQQELQEMMDEREFYLRERNFFRDMLARSNPGPLPVRPHSPPSRRGHTVGSSVAETSPRTEYSRHEAEDLGVQRHRTGDYQPPITSQSPSTPYNSLFPPAGPSMALPAPSAPSNYSDPRSRHTGPPPPATRPPPYDPLRRDISERDWTAGR